MDVIFKLPPINCNILLFVISFLSDLCNEKAFEATKVSLKK
jgi:hypothetical protein